MNLNGHIPGEAVPAFRQFLVERLLRFLVALNQDVEIVVRPHRGRSDTAVLLVS